jgi:hypothetical protein
VAEADDVAVELDGALKLADVLDHVIEGEHGTK